MSVIRPQAQVHDGFATIRSRGQYRPTIRPERCRTLSLKSDYSADEQLLEPSVYSNPTLHQSSPFHKRNYDNSTATKMQISSSSSSSPKYQNFKKNAPYTCSSIPKFTKDETAVDYSKLDSPYINSKLSTFVHRSCDELEDKSNFRSFGINDSISGSPCRIPLMKSATLQHKRTSFSAALKDNNDCTVSNDDLSSLSSSGESNGYVQNSSYFDTKKSLEYYNPGTNYYRPLTALLTTNQNRSTSAEILDNDDLMNETPSRIPKMLSIGRQDAIIKSKDRNLRRYHTLGHTRSAGNQRAMMMMIAASNYSNGDLNSKDELDDLLDFKVGCQTMAHGKPTIPWYELAISKDLKRKSCPLINNQAHVVAAFEQSLSNMTTRLQQLTATAERKDGELTDMRQTIELLRKQSIQAGLTSAHMQSMGVQQTSVDNQKLNSKINNQNSPNNMSPAKRIGQNSTLGIQQQHSSDSMNSLNSISSGCSGQDKKKKKGWLRSSFTKAFSRNAKITKTNRNINSDVTNDHNSTINSKTQSADLQNIPKNSNLPPPSPTKRNLQKPVTIVDNAKPVDSIELEGNPVVDNLKKQLREKDLVLTDIRLEALSSASQLENLRETVMKMRTEMLSLKQNNDRLQKLVTTRSLAGSDLSLGNSTSPSGSISETRRYSLADSNNRPPMDLPRTSFQEEEVEEENLPPGPAPEPPPSSLSPTTHIDLTPPPPAIEPPPSPSHMPINASGDDIPDPTEGKKISIAVYLGQPESFTKYLEEIYEYDISLTTAKQITKDINNENTEDITDVEIKFKNVSLNEFVIAYTYISGKTSWQNLDYIVRKTFKDYVSRIDPGTNLGLNTDSITSYHLGEAKRGPEIGFPELLPCGYIIGNVKTLYICLQGVGSLAFDSLIPRSIVHRYISLLTEHRRLILCGPSGTGKSYLARKLAEFLVARSGKGNPSEAIATFNVDHKSSKDLRQFLGLIAEQASISNGSSELPSVIILDNLHHASALGDVFSCLLSSGPAAKLPCIIGTMSQATCNTTNLQLHHNFRWVLTANHMEPVKGFLGRFLRRRVFTLELQTQNHKPELSSVLAWLSNVWQHINRFLENHSSSDVTIGPRLFLACPLDLKDSQVWFTDVWNYHLAPYIIDAVREGVQLYGRRGGSWNDPSEYIRDTYPWSYGPDSVPPLRQINAEDVGLEGESTGSNESHDPLLNMLIHLQEAANYSGTQENESDCISLDSNITAES